MGRHKGTGRVGLVKPCDFGTPVTNGFAWMCDRCRQRLFALTHHELHVDVNDHINGEKRVA